MATQNNDIKESVLAYLRLEMSETEQKAFEAELLTNPELKTEYELMRHIKAAIYHIEKEDDLHTKQKVATMFQHARARNKRKRQIFLAFVCIGIIGGFAFFATKYGQNAVPNPQETQVLPPKNDTLMQEIAKVDTPKIAVKSATITEIVKPNIIQDPEYVASIQALNKQKTEIIALARKGASLNVELTEKTNEVNICDSIRGAKKFAGRKFPAEAFQYLPWVDTPDELKNFTLQSDLNKEKKNVADKENYLFERKRNFVIMLNKLDSNINLCKKHLKRYCP